LLHITENTYLAPASRIDLLWFPDSLIEDLCYNRVWSLPSGDFNTNPSLCTDHKCLIVYFTKSLFIPDLPLHRRKQKKEWRTIYDLKNTNDTQWAQFKTLLATHLSHFENNHFFPISFTLHPDVVMLNYKWTIFRRSTIAAANEALPTKKISPYLSDSSGELYQLRSIKACLNTINQTYSLLSHICFPLIDRSSLHQLEFEWSRKPELNKRSLLIGCWLRLRCFLRNICISQINF
jgi:hypothetical protein